MGIVGHVGAGQEGTLKNGKFSLVIPIWFILSFQGTNEDSQSLL